MMYQQHIRCFAQQGNNACLRHQILEDIQAQVAEWQAEGDMIIILADINKDIHKDPIHATF